jgi:hypothetical protein
MVCAVRDTRWLAVKPMRSAHRADHAQREARYFASAYSPLRLL